MPDGEIEPWGMLSYVKNVEWCEATKYNSSKEAALEKQQKVIN